MYKTTIINILLIKKKKARVCETSAAFWMVGDWGCLGVLWKRVVLLFSGYIFIVKLLITSDEKNNYFLLIKYILLVTGS